MGASMNSSAAKNRGTPRRRMTVEKRREQIMDAARDIANAEGFHAVTLDRVAEACGITRTLIYQQFGNLSGLLVAMVDREYTRAALIAFRHSMIPLAAISSGKSGVNQGLVPPGH